MVTCRGAPAEARGELPRHSQGYKVKNMHAGRISVGNRTCHKWTLGGMDGYIAATEALPCT